MLRVGIVGFGFMGRMHYKCWSQRPDAQVVAICDSNPRLQEDIQKSVGNIDGAAQGIDLSKLRLFSTYDEMLAAKAVDVVSITLPTHLHPEFAIKALKAGLNVLCEKPMALDVAGCKRMIEAAKKARRTLQIGHCVRFWPEYAVAKEIIDSGQYGKIRSAMLQRLSSAPTWSIDGWLADEKRSGGVVLDLHIHDTDYVQYLMGIPRAVRSFAVNVPRTKSALHVVTHYLYGDDRLITAEGGWGMMPSFGFEMSFNILLEKATLVYDCTRTPALRVCPVSGAAFTPQVPAGDGYARQIDHFVRTVRGEKVPPVTSLKESMNSVRIVQAEIASARTGRTVNLR